MRLLPGDVWDAYPRAMEQLAMLRPCPEELEPGCCQLVHWHQVRAPFHRGLLKQALDRVVHGHPVLRTSFDLERFSQPLQRVHRWVAVPLEVTDGQGLSEAEAEQVQEHWLQAAQTASVGGSVPPLLRVHMQVWALERFTVCSVTLSSGHC